jgi:alanyl-tRNA synthetase
MKADQVRQVFLDFYRSKDHQFVKSAPLVPHDDATLLFTSAGMVQFKRYFAGSVPVPFPRAVSVQKCLRVTDIDDVGRTPRHDTFFEMLGHFSFGDYFKREAIGWNWELFTRVYGLDPALLTASVYEADDEAYGIWRNEVGLPPEKIVRLGAKDNFWGPAGGTGACGPCSEIYCDLGPEVDADRPNVKPGDDCNRFVEVGNFVFPQFDRQADGTDLPLKNRGIDTGIGLERLCMVLQGKKSIFHTDLFWPLVEEAARVCGRPYQGHEVPLHIIADHVRALTFALGEGILPSNEGRGYVIRRLIRRAAVQGHTLGVTQPFLYKFVDHVVAMMRSAYPEVEEGRKRAALSLQNEEERFHATLEQSVGKLQVVIDRTRHDRRAMIAGEDAFVLYDTHGLPLDLIRDMALGQGLAVDQEGFERCMAEQKERSRASASFQQEAEALAWTEVSAGADSEFLGYDTIRVEGARVRRVAPDGADGQTLLVVFDRTPCYGESGGQVGDTGTLACGDLSLAVSGTLRRGHEIRHRVTAAGSGGGVAGAPAALARLSDPQARWTVQVDEERRHAIRRHHTATHLLQAALRRVLGEHVAQAGSLVAPDRLRFDFSHFSALSVLELEEVERLVNAAIQQDVPVKVSYSTYDEAVAAGVTALFGEKYEADRVRRVRVTGVSEELCGGTHVGATGEIGSLLVIDEGAVAAGTRRIEAVCGQRALAEAQQMRARLDALRRALGTSVDALPEKVGDLVHEVSALRRDLAKARSGEGVSRLDELLRRAEKVGRFRYLVGEVSAANAGELRALGDRVRGGLGSGAAILHAKTGEKTSFLAVVSEDLAGAGRLRADELIRAVAAVADGSGGGRPQMALGGAGDPAKVGAAVKEAARLLHAGLEKIVAEEG